MCWVIVCELLLAPEIIPFDTPIKHAPKINFGNVKAHTHTHSLFLTLEAPQNSSSARRVVLLYLYNKSFHSFIFEVFRRKLRYSYYVLWICWLKAVRAAAYKLNLVSSVDNAMRQWNSEIKMRKCRPRVQGIKTEHKFSLVQATKKRREVVDERVKQMRFLSPYSGTRETNLMLVWTGGHSDKSICLSEKLLNKSENIMAHLWTNGDPEEVNIAMSMRKRYFCK